MIKSGVKPGLKDETKDRHSLVVSSHQSEWSYRSLSPHYCLRERTLRSSQYCNSQGRFLNSRGSNPAIFPGNSSFWDYGKNISCMTRNVIGIPMRYMNRSQRTHYLVEVHAQNNQNRPTMLTKFVPLTCSNPLCHAKS